MGINNNRPCFTRLPLGDRKDYEKPAIWVDKLPLVSIICAGSVSGNTGEGGDANQDHIFRAEEEDHNICADDKDRNLWSED